MFAQVLLGIQSRSASGRSFAACACVRKEWPGAHLGVTVKSVRRRLIAVMALLVLAGGFAVAAFKFEVVGNVVEGPVSASDQIRQCESGISDTWAAMACLRDRWLTAGDPQELREFADALDEAVL